MNPRKNLLKTLENNIIYVVDEKSTVKREYNILL
jgi:hypothetical protein